MNKKVNEFCHKYDAYVQLSSRMYRRFKRPTLQIWSDSDPEMFQSMPSEDVKCVEVHMPEDRFHALLEHDQWLELEQRRGDLRGLNAVRIASEREQENRLRHEHPGLMDAWQQYQTMLQLVK